MANIVNTPAGEEMNEVILTDEPVIEVTDEAAPAESPAPEAVQQEETAVSVTFTPVPATPTPTAAPTPTPTAEATATVTVTATPTAVPGGGETNMLPFIIGGVVLIAAVIGALASVLIRGRKKSVQQPSKKVMEEAPQTVAQPDGPPIYTGPDISVGMAQTIGSRKNQQDSLYCSDWKNPEALAARGLLAAVADGIGGLADGNLASGAAMKAMRARFLGGAGMGSMSDRLLELGAAAQQEVLAVNGQRTARSGSTLVTVLIADGNMVFLSIGDSRICLCRSGALLQLNREHVLGRINREKQAFGHAIDPSRKPEALTAYLGQEGLQLIDRSLNPMRLVPGDRIVLMSDGVFGTLSDAELLQHLRLAPQQAAESIIKAVDQRQKPHQDNATVLIIGIG